MSKISRSLKLRFYAKMSHLVSQSRIGWHSSMTCMPDQNGGEGEIGEAAPHR